MSVRDGLLTRLRSTLDRPDTVLLIGSGVSAWSGLPNWTTLLTRLADFVESYGRDAGPVRQEIAHGDLLLAASYAVHQLNLREFGAFIRQVTNHGIAKPAEIHRLIASLGPTCFITTNYDRLLEDSLTEYSRNNTPTVVTNRQAAEIADIIPSYARKFVFKYHGDVEDAASIILTRDQYRRIQYEFPGTIRAFSALLATRPVVMIGFGLRDLDFLAVQDDLIAAFEGQVGEYFALMPDFDRLRCEYWRKTYRTDVISYDTITKPDGTLDHSNLLTLLRSLQPEKPTSKPISPSKPSPIEEATLLLARLAASTVRKKPVTADEVLPLTVSAETDSKGIYPFHQSGLQELLRTFEKSFILLGVPGAGKSFALANYAAELASTLLEQCMQEETLLPGAHVVVFVNLAIYAGDLRTLIKSNLPTGLEVEPLLEDWKCTLILDGANELPRTYIENGQWLADFQNLQSSAQNCRIIVGSRNETWLSSIDLPRFNISDIDIEFVESQLTSMGFADTAQNPELIKTFSKPLFFSLAKDLRIVVRDVATPADVYASFFSLVDANWLKEYQGQPINFASSLEAIAFGMLEIGAEFAAKDEFDRALRALHPKSTQEAISYLLAAGVLVALAGHRLSFFHQSITEYLAARIIARQFLENRNSLSSRLEDKRWDQALFLAMNLLDANEQQAFLDVILETDLAAAARAAHYLEHNKVAVVNKIICRACIAGAPVSHDTFQTNFELALQMEHLPYTDGNVDALRRLLDAPEALGGVAAGALFRLRVNFHKSILDEVLRSHVDDWNYVNTFIDMTTSYWSKEDLEYLFAELRGIRKYKQPLHLFGELFVEKIPTAKLFSWSKSCLQEDTGAKYALIEALENTDTSEARSILFDFVRAGDGEAIYSLYSNLEYHSKGLQPKEVFPSAEIAKSIVKNLRYANGEWALELAMVLIKKNSKWRGAFKAVGVRGKSQCLLIDIITSNEESLPIVVADAIPRVSQYKEYSLRILGHLRYWRSAPLSIVMSALLERNATLATRILQNVQGKELPLLDYKPLDWWLDWTAECIASKVRHVWWCGYYLHNFMKGNDGATIKEILSRFNGKPEKEFKRIGTLLFWDGAGRVSTDQLSEDALHRLVNVGDKYKFAAQVLGHASTERFVETVLIPRLIANLNSRWLQEALEIAGRRHNRRYLFSARSSLTK